MIDKDFLKRLPYKGRMANVDREIANGLKDAGYISELKKGYMVIPVRRYQKDIQAGQISIRLAVCYLPRDGRNDRYFKGVGKTHGGECIFEYDLAVKVPLFIRSGCGGHGYEIAAKTVNANIEQIESFVMQTVHRYTSLRSRWYDHKDTEECIKGFIKETLSSLIEHGYREYNILEEIAGILVSYGRRENILNMALREIIYLDAIRRNGHDSIVCYNHTRDGKAFINEVSDLRTVRYPYNYDCELIEIANIHSRFVSKRDRDFCVI